MKFGYASVLLSIIGIGFVIWFNLQMSESFKHQYLQSLNKGGQQIVNFTNEAENKLVALVIGFLSLLFGLKSLVNKHRIGLIGIILSILLIALSFLPIWTYLISDSAMDVNFH